MDNINKEQIWKKIRINIILISIIIVVFLIFMNLFVFNNEKNIDNKPASEINFIDKENLAKDRDLNKREYKETDKNEKIKEANFISVSEYSPVFKENVVMKYNKEIKEYPIRIEFIGGLPINPTSYGTTASGNVISSNENNIKTEANEFFDKYKAILGVNKEEFREEKIKKIGKQEFISFEQEYKGIPVYLGKVMLVKSDNKWLLYNSNFYNNINIGIKPKISKEKAIEIAKKEYVTSDNLLEKPELMIYPYLSQNSIKYYLAYKLEFPYGDYNGKTIRPTVFVDSIEGKIIDVLDNIRTAIVSGKITGNIIPDYPEQTKETREFSHENIISGIYSTTSDISGDFNFDIGSNSKIISSLEGPYVKLINNAQPRALTEINVPPYQANIDWNSYDNSYKKEESNVFYHVNKIHDYFSRDEFPFDIYELDYKMDANVEVSGTCNAFSDGTSIYFLRANYECEALSLYSDAIYHEYTHNAIKILAPILSSKYRGQTGNMEEGYSDYFPCTLNEDSCLSNNWAGDDCLRNCENKKKYPEDYDDEPHFGAEIISGSIWDIRKTLGKDMTDSIAVIALSYDPQTFQELLVNFLIADDATYGNSNLNDGTPHGDTICKSFFLNHGIYNDHCLNSMPLISFIDKMPIIAKDSIINIKGIVAGTDFKNYRLYFGNGENPTRWFEIVNNDVRVINNILYGNVHTDFLTEPVNYFKLVVYGNNGGSEEYLLKVFVDKSDKLPQTTNVKKFQIYGDKIAYGKSGFGTNSDIYMYDITENTNKQITCDVLLALKGCSVR